MQERIYISRREDIAYAMSAGGYTLSSSFLGLYITYFYVSVFGIDAGIVATILFFVGIWDAVNDPIMGTLIDKTRTRFGKLLPYLRIVPLPLMLVSVLLFSGPVLFPNEGSTSAKKIIYMIVTYLCWEFFATIADVPFWGLSAAVSPSSIDRTKIISHAKLINALVGNIPTVVVPVFIDLSTHGIASFSLSRVFFILGFIFAVAGMSLFSTAGLTMKERVVSTVDHVKISDCFRSLAGNKPMLLLIAYSLINQFCNFSGIFVTYYYIDVLGSMTISLLIGTPGTIVNFLSYLYVPALRKRFSDKQLLFATSIFSAFSFAVLYFVCKSRSGDMAFMVPALMLQGLSVSFFLGIRAVLPTQMLCETVDYMEWKSGIRSEGIAFSMLNLMNKLGANIGRSLGLFLLSAVGYVASTDGHTIVQSAATKNGIFMMYTIIPYALSLIALIPLFFYDLSGEKRERMIKDLDERRSKIAGEIDSAN